MRLATYLFFFDVPTHEERKVWIFEGDHKTAMIKTQQAMKKKERKKECMMCTSEVRSW